MSALGQLAHSRRNVYILSFTFAIAAASGFGATQLASVHGIVLTAVLAPLAVTHYFIAVRRNGLLSPDGLFFAAQLVMAVGTFQLADLTSPVDSEYSTIVALACSAYTATSLLTYLAETRGKRTEPRYDVHVLAPTGSIKIGLAVSVLVVAAYFQAVGYSAFFVGLQGQLDGQKADVASLRLDSYAGGRYLFPGYVNQFKNAILPGLSLVFTTWATSRRGLLVRLLSWALLALSAVGLMWTGQRGAFVSFVLTATLYAVLYNRKRLSRWMLIIPLIGFPLLLLATTVLARGDSATEGITARVLNDNQLSGLAAFRYTEPQPTQWGAEWGQALMGVLPGNRGSTLSGEVFATLYGSTRGTSPPSLWGSVHYNFGLFGVLTLAVVLGVVVQLWTCRSLRGERYNTLQLAGFAGATVSFGTWIADGPTTLLNVGLVAYALLWWWGSRIAPAQEKGTAPRPGPKPPSCDGAF
ncbi:O-antigen polymerase [Actinoplanes sp. NPDC051475]|uniref:O-antigen polymerase n=1 Tax=Actinoplanes sp. NPDC051475 TaxID=3157225 RepID=UPI003450AD31